MEGPVQRKHPTALYILITAAAGERFSYYGMRALLILYMVASVPGNISGMGFTESSSGLIYGFFTSACYLFPFFGGLLADRKLGDRKSLSIGAVIILIGLLVLASSNMIMPFFAGLSLIAAGNGFFKPTIVTMIGKLYEQGDQRRDSAYTLYYQLFNGSVFLAPIVCGGIAIEWGYRAGFAAAALAVGISMLIYWILAPGILKDVGKFPSAILRNSNASLPRNPLNKEERDRILVIFILMFTVIFFWSGYEQAGSSMSLYTEKYINRSILGITIPTTWFQSVNPLLVFILGFPITSVLGWLSMRRKGLSTPVKMGIGMILLGVGFLFMVGAVAQRGGDIADTRIKAGMGWLLVAYLFSTLGELMLSPIGFSMVSKLAPSHMVGMFMGVWFGSMAIANLLGGIIASVVPSLGASYIFGFVAVFVTIIGIITLFISKNLLFLMHGRD
ncbi:MAG: peptide MFS transporter [Bacteroidetes bacterium]|nr:peptide MFS transporter [Bacteroidota bacterium]